METESQSWTAHIRATLSLALPLIGGQLAVIGLGVTDTLMLGQLGAEPLAAGVLGQMLYFFALMGGTGLTQAMTPVVASARGAGDEQTVRRALRMLLWLVILYAALLMPVLWQAEAILLMLGQEPELAALSGSYVRIAQWALFLNLAAWAFRDFLSAVERTRVVFFAMLAGLAMNAVLDYIFIFGHFGAPALGVRGASIATLGTNVIVSIFLLAYLLRTPEIARYEIFARFWRPDWEMMGRLFRLGWPVSLTMLAEVSLFSGSSVMMGWVGTIELAAHGIALQIISVIFMVPLGFAFAAAARVGIADGAGRFEDRRRAAITVLWLALGVTVVAAIFLWIVPRPLIAVFMGADVPDAEAVIGYGVALLGVAAIFQIADTSQVVGAGLLRGIKDTKVPMMIAIASYVIIAIPAAWAMAFPLGLGGVGIWLGLAVGLFLAGGLMNARFFRLIR